MYENKLEFPGVGVGGCKTKTFPGGSMDIFWNCTMQLRYDINFALSNLPFQSNVSFSIIVHFLHIVMYIKVRVE